MKEAMLADIEEMMVKEMNGLCGSCVHFDECVYRKNSTKVIIQCEVFESVRTNGIKTRHEDAPLRGLCLNCSRNQVCHLPKEPTGVWHCEEYE